MGNVKFVAFHLAVLAPGGQENYPARRYASALFRIARKSIPSAWHFL